MSDAVKRLKKALKEFGDMVPEDVALAARGVVAELSRARAEALEEAATWVADAASQRKVGGDDKAADTLTWASYRLRRLAGTTPPASIPVERVREVLALTKATAQQRSKGKPDKERVAQGVYAVVDHVARELGVPLDAAQEHPACPYCTERHPRLTSCHRHPAAQDGPTPDPRDEQLADVLDVMQRASASHASEEDEP